MSLIKKIHGSSHGFSGLFVAWHEESTFKFEVFCAIGAIVASWFFQISRMEWFWVIAMIGFVLTAEILNTALEEFCDMVKSDPDPHVGKIKDLGAAAVLVSWFTAFIVGLAIFIPYLGSVP